MKPQAKPHSKKIRFPVQVLLGIMVLAAIVYAILITGPTDSSVVPVPPTHTPVPTALTQTPINASAPAHNTKGQTDGVIVGAVSVMLILLGGTLVAIYPSLKRR